MRNWRIIGSIRAVETIAKGKGIRELRRLSKAYGGKKGLPDRDHSHW